MTRNGISKKRNNQQGSNKNEYERYADDGRYRRDSTSGCFERRPFHAQRNKTANSTDTQAKFFLVNITLVNQLTETTEPSNNKSSPASG
ncbi:MAG: hypothetical protein RL040_201 [Bacteroidota bacterium]